MLGHDGDEKLKNVMEVVVFMNGMKVVQNAVQLVIFDALSFQNKLLDEEQKVRSDIQDGFSGQPRFFCWNKNKLIHWNKLGTGIYSLIKFIDLFYSRFFLLLTLHFGFDAASVGRVDDVVVML